MPPIADSAAALLTCGSASAAGSIALANSPAFTSFPSWLPQQQKHAPDQDPWQVTDTQPGQNALQATIMEPIQPPGHAAMLEPVRTADSCKVAADSGGSSANACAAAQVGAPSCGFQMAEADELTAAHADGLLERGRCWTAVEEKLYEPRVRSCPFHLHLDLL